MILLKQMLSLGLLMGHFFVLSAGRIAMKESCFFPFIPLNPLNFCLNLNAYA